MDLRGSEDELMGSLALRIEMTGDLRAYTIAREAVVAGAMMRGVRQATQRLKMRLRADVLRAGLGQRLANTWRDRVYPERLQSLGPAGIVYSKAAHIVRAFEDGVTIRSESGFWLAIPSDEVPESMRRGARNKKRLTPAILEQRLGIKLRFVPVLKGGAAGRFALLVADDVRRRTGKRGGFAPATRAAKDRGAAESIVMFILVPQVSLRKRLHVAVIEAQMRQELPAILAREIAVIPP